MINQTPERLKQTTAKKDLYKGKYRLVTTQQQKKQTSVVTWIHSNIWNQNTKTKP